MLVAKLDHLQLQVESGIDLTLWNYDPEIQFGSQLFKIGGIEWRLMIWRGEVHETLGPTLLAVVQCRARSKLSARLELDVMDDPNKKPVVLFGHDFHHAFDPDEPVISTWVPLSMLPLFRFRLILRLRVKDIVES